MCASLIAACYNRPLSGIFSCIYFHIYERRMLLIGTTYNRYDIIFNSGLFQRVVKYSIFQKTGIKDHQSEASRLTQMHTYCMGLHITMAVYMSTYINTPIIIIGHI
jgi:hypothetical protein